jgi:hypothetical protein
MLQLHVKSLVTERLKKCSHTCLAYMLCLSSEHRDAHPIYLGIYLPNPASDQKDRPRVLSLQLTFVPVESCSHCPPGLSRTSLRTSSFQAQSKSNIAKHGSSSVPSGRLLQNHRNWTESVRGPSPALKKSRRALRNVAQVVATGQIAISHDKPRAPGIGYMP